MRIHGKANRVRKRTGNGSRPDRGMSGQLHNLGAEKKLKQRKKKPKKVPDTTHHYRPRAKKKELSPVVVAVRKQGGQMAACTFQSSRTAVRKHQRKRRQVLA